MSFNFAQLNFCNPLF